jgi:hypothetical protein
MNTVALQFKTRNVFAYLNAQIVGSNPTHGTDVYVFLCMRFTVYVAALRQADLLSKESYRLSVKFTISEINMNGNRKRA